MSSSLREHPVFAVLASAAGGQKRQPEIRLLTQAIYLLISVCNVQNTLS